MDLETIKAKVTAAGEKVKALKTEKVDKALIDAAVAELNQLKEEQEKIAPGTTNQGRKPAEKKEKPVEEKKEAKKEEEKGETKLGLDCTKADFFNWYPQVITKSEMIEYYDIGGCYILRPWSYSIWEHIQSFFDKKIKLLGVQNTYFPCFVSSHALKREANHIEGFAPEVAWVTKSGESDLAEPIAVRPTSETVMYPAFSKWIQSHRDLPLKINQWCNVVRWEFSNPTPFIRTREFLWQEGHTAYSNKKDAEEEVYAILELYKRVYEEMLAVPMIKGVKTEKEKFAGADFTTTIEGFIPAVGRGIQAATSHHLGQNFARMFDIKFSAEDGSQNHFAYQNSWGLTTRSIGVMVMVHGDDKGVVLPPRVAPIQIVIVPIYYKGKEAGVNEACKSIQAKLIDAEVRSHVDDRTNYTPGWRYSHWELKGVPIRIELGPRDAEQKTVVAVRRDTGEKITFAHDDALVANLRQLLDKIHNEMLQKARDTHMSRIIHVKNWSEVTPALNARNIVNAAHCRTVECETNIKNRTRDEAGQDDEGGKALSGAAKSLCIPLEPLRKLEPGEKCIGCDKEAVCLTLFGRSY